MRSLQTCRTCCHPLLRLALLWMPLASQIATPSLFTMAWVALQHHAPGGPSKSLDTNSERHLFSLSGCCSDASHKLRVSDDSTHIQRFLSISLCVPQSSYAARVYVLDGGLPAWRAASGDVDSCPIVAGSPEDAAIHQPALAVQAVGASGSPQQRVPVFTAVLNTSKVGLYP
jgi:hypothetical protein